MRLSDGKEIVGMPCELFPLCEVELIEEAIRAKELDIWLAGADGPRPRGYPEQVSDPFGDDQAVDDSSDDEEPAPEGRYFQGKSGNNLSLLD
jgi:hypothetical protein